MPGMTKRRSWTRNTGAGNLVTGLRNMTSTEFGENVGAVAASIGNSGSFMDS